ncbi:hypothetical protein [Halobaculum sp. MBLA0143]|uniref:hypothetical protein n=1 Tax=Halobaculum sp. MBLA0143 TaxID=3079933 RepID=UPI0035237349
MSVRSLLGFRTEQNEEVTGSLVSDSAEAAPDDGWISDGGVTQEQTGPQSRRDWLLLLLYATDTDGDHAPVSGLPTLSMSLFVLQRNFDEFLDTRLPFTFESSELGPTDGELESVVSDLRGEYLTRNSLPESDGQIDEYEYALTEEGRDWAEDQVDSLSDQERNELYRVKRQVALGDTGDLVTYAYRKDSSMFEGNLVRR